LVRHSRLDDVRIRMIVLLDLLRDSCSSHEAFVVRIFVVWDGLLPDVSLESLAATQLSMGSIGIDTYVGRGG
jgi:hypothetical protein